MKILRQEEVCLKYVETDIIGSRENVTVHLARVFLVFDH